MEEYPYGLLQAMNDVLRDEARVRAAAERRRKRRKGK